MVIFDIKYLFIPEISKKFNAISDYAEKVEFIFRLLDFDINFKEYADKINDNWINNVDERYSAENYAFMTNEKNLITEYACKTQDTEKLFELINKLCNPEIYDYDTVVAEAENSIAIIANIDDFEFTDFDTEISEQKQSVKRTSLDVLLGFEPRK